MKILILPSLLILLPIGILFLFINYWKKRKIISIGEKIVLGITFIIIGLLNTIYAMTVSIDGMADKNVGCMTGVIVLIPFGLLTYIVGVPLLLSLSKSKSLKV
ncbi:hypothetical protein [Dyadobacter sp. NIV53]|uniref:hypothetical protein n=1 Tax=Dyadobacter sp. NIV53 TaxID=2861765 RepID=UPI001C877DD7|nr:hypothetical protein [Dyadobacter sp. NIV53]